MKENLAELIEALTGRQQEAERRLSELRAQIDALEARIAELSKFLTPHSAASAQADAAQKKTEKTDQVTPEILVMLAAAATAFLGKEVRIRSARKLQSPYGTANLWAQQGRVSIQASHSLRLRR